MLFRSKFAPEEGDTVLVSRMRDGGQCVLAEQKILGAVTDTINRLAEDGCELVVLLCTGKFPKISCKVPLITPYSLLHGVVGGIYDKGTTIGVVAPHPQQTEHAAGYWKDDGYNAVSASVSPYIGGDMVEIINKLELAKPQVILLDCLGYSVEMKKEVKKVFSGPVILPRTLIAQTLNEMFA